MQVVIVATCEALDDVPAQLRRSFTHELSVPALSNTARAELLQVSCIVLSAGLLGRCAFAPGHARFYSTSCQQGARA